jgi:nicotinate-nucleotide pyrophosphorylase (carboxylating)
MQRMSGIATATARMVAEVDRGSRVAEAAAAGGSRQRCRVLETRKTAPGLRLFDKWAVLIGGGSNHRMGLFDMIMVKDNHVAAAGGIVGAVAAVAAFLGSERGRETARALAAARGGVGGVGGAGAVENIPVEIEVRTLDEVDQLVAVLRAAGRGKGAAGQAAAAAAAGGAAAAAAAEAAAKAAANVGGGGEWVTRVMLDNMVRRLSPQEAEEAARRGVEQGTPQALDLAAGVDCSVLREAVKRLAEFWAPGAPPDSLPPLETEASGNVTEATAAAVASTGVGFVSVGALTHSVAALDVSFNVDV